VLDDGGYKYVYGLGLAYAVDSLGNTLTQHTDGLGSVRAETDSSGNVVQTYGTDEFGIVDAALTSGTQPTPFQYTGEPRDSETGLVYLRARSYDPAVGRFMQADPVRKSWPGVIGWNRYSYVGNNPATLADPTGYGSSRVGAQVCIPTLGGQLTCLAPAQATPTPEPTTVPETSCPQSAGRNFFQQFVNGTLVLAGGPEGGQDCHANAQIPLYGGGDIINFHIKFDQLSSNFFAVVTGIIGLSLKPNVVQLGPTEPAAALLVVHDLAGIVGIFEGNGGFDAPGQLYGDLLPNSPECSRYLDS